MIKWGVILIFIGIGSFILPLLGMQFRLINLFGDNPAASAVVFIIVGGVLLAVGRTRERNSQTAGAPQRTAAQSPAAALQDPAPARIAGSPRFCGNCGAAVEAGAKFCESCGQAVSSVTGLSRT